MAVRLVGGARVRDGVTAANLLARRLPLAQGISRAVGLARGRRIARGVGASLPIVLMADPRNGSALIVAAFPLTVWTLRDLREERFIT